MPFKGIVDPFGEADCETELSKYGKQYENLFFDEAPFNKPAIETFSYLIVGRKGAGKTALSTFLSFQTTVPNSRYVVLDVRQIYKQIFRRESTWIDQRRQLVIPELATAWDLIVWSHIIEEVREDIVVKGESSKWQILSPASIFEWLAQIIVAGDAHKVSSDLERINNETDLEDAKTKICNLCSRQPLIVAIDTLEQYDVNDNLLMYAQAALIEFAARFNATFSERGLHLKVFVPGEIFPYLYQRVVLNPSKSIKHPVFLLWRARDLLRLICWRLFKRLEAAGHTFSNQQLKVDWDDYNAVLEHMWMPFFGRQIENGIGHMEDSFPYVLRHTQMRPRQLIYLCNAIANRSLRSGRFPQAMADDVRDGVKEGENWLAQEILNSYSSVHENVDKIIKALEGAPMRFPGSELDRRAKRTRSQWPPGRYSLDEFRRVVAEIGVVGRVRHGSRDSRFISAEFEYSLPHHLNVAPEDDCVIHPMFYTYLNTQPQNGSIVMPFQREDGKE
jgi:hypothetical protein